MNRTLCRFVLLAACVALTGATYGQDSNDQSLGDIVRKDQAKPKAKAKVTLDEDNSRPAPPDAVSNTASDNTASGSQAQDSSSADQSPDKTASSQTAPTSPPSAQTQAKLSALDNEEKGLKSGIEMLQERIADPQSSDDAKRVWQEAVTHSQDRLAAIEKERQALQSASGSDTQQAPAPQPAPNPQQ